MLSSPIIYAGQTSWELSHILAQIQAILINFPIKQSRICQEGNSVADYLANLALQDRRSHIFYDHILPHHIKVFVS